MHKGRMRTPCVPSLKKGWHAVEPICLMEAKLSRLNGSTRLFKRWNQASYQYL